MLHLLFSTVKGFRTFWAVGFKTKEACFDARADGCVWMYTGQRQLAI